jgi:drug/metabolite transporter (DMT)-like permease
LTQRAPLHAITVEHAAPESRWIGAGLCTLSAAGFASLTILGKIALSVEISLPTLLGFRFGGAGLLLLFYLGVIRKRSLRPARRDFIILCALGGIGYAGQSTLYFAALGRNPASLNSLLLYVYPIFVALVEWLVKRRPPSWAEWLAMALAAGGIVLTLGLDPASSTGLDVAIDPVGVAFVLLSAAGYALYFVGSEAVVHRVGPWLSTAWITSSAGVSFTLAGAVTGTLDSQLDAQAITLILSMAVFSTILPLGTLLAGIRRVGPTTASLLSTLEPVFTVVAAVLLLNETLSSTQMLGGGLVLGAVLLLGLAG